MRKTASHGIAKSIRQTILLVVCSVFLGSAAYAQNGGSGNTSSCTVTGLRLTISTADDDLRGGKDNLNIIVYFSGGAYQLAPNVNHGQNWPNNSTDTIAINLNRPVPPNEILGLRLIHIPDGGFNLNVSPELATLAAPFVIAEAFQSPDNWNMGDIEIAAIGNGFGATIGHHGFHRFTGSDPALSISVQAPANICPARPNEGIGVLNPGSSGLHSVTGAGSKYGELTNQDVVRMAKAGVPDSAIIASIRSSQPKFDLSPGALIALKHEGVSPNIQEVMRERSLNGGNQPAGAATGMLNGGSKADELSPQPYPPKARTNTSLKGATPKWATVKPGLKLGPPKTGSKIVNSRATQLSMPILSALQTQRQAANTEATTMKTVSVQSQAQPGVVGPSQPTTLNGGARTLLPAMQSPARTAVSGGSAPSSTQIQTKAAAPSTLAVQKNPSVGAVGPSQTMSASGSPSLTGAASATGTLLPQTSSLNQPANGNGSGASSSNGGTLSSISHLNPAVYGNGIVLACSTDPTMRIMNVSGSSSPGTFTPIDQYNFYTITGCSFGNTGPNAKVYIYKGSSFHEEFQIQEWHDNWIKLNLDPTLSGVLDQDSLTLVVQRADGMQASKGGFSFYAARSRVQLASIPNSDFSLYRFSLYNTSDWQDLYTSPASQTDGWGFGGMTAEVLWGDPDLTYATNGKFLTSANTPPSGTDIYDFSHLQPGFAPTDASISWQNGDCSPVGGTLFTNGNFSGQFNGSQLWITWQGQNCKNVDCGTGGFGSIDCFGNIIPLTNYAIDVWVDGPRGVDPWTGLPTRP